MDKQRKIEEIAATMYVYLTRKLIPIETKLSSEDQVSLDGIVSDAATNLAGSIVAGITEK